MSTTFFNFILTITATISFVIVRCIQIRLSEYKNDEIFKFDERSHGLILLSFVCDITISSDFWLPLHFALFIALVWINIYIMDEVDFIRHSFGYDAGSAMAINYYFGYLKLMLPDHKTPGLKERILNYEAKEDVHFPVKKLFIILPKSMYSPNLLDEDGALERPENKLEPNYLNRGGIPKREYANAVYKIKQNKPKEWYVAAEVATPLVTYYEYMSSVNTPQNIRDEIFNSFKKALEELLWDDLSCRGHYHLLEYDDFDERGNRKSLSELLIREITKLTTEFH